MAQVRVIIVAYNSEKVISRCLEALTLQTYTDWAVTVVDNASSDASVEIVKKMMPSAIIQCMADNIGYAQANNWGIEHSQEPYLFLLNPDCFIEENYIAE
ncbi:MAG TPA: glycosyltransferase, partial [Patescibacteria group bacterium]|nr:glycosyltransferase [Patescibacteria group bacterium]